MQSAIQTLEAMDFSVKSPSLCVQQVRTYIESAPIPVDAAIRVIYNITSIAVEFDDLETALHVAQYVAYDAVKLDSYDFQASIDHAFKRTADLYAKNPWAKVAIEKATIARNEVAVVAGVDLKVAVKADGKIKKGGKGPLAAELYKIHVTNATAPLSNQDFIKVLMKELDMSKAGATTYAYNCNKAAKQAA